MALIFLCLGEVKGMEEEFEISEGKLKRLRNLKLYRDKTDEEIIEMLKSRRETVKTPKTSLKTYDQRFEEKMKLLQEEFGVDMNDANDAEMLANLTRQILQAENIDKDIRHLQDQESKSKDDVATLKSLGDFQRNIYMTISDLQDKLGISRKVRKEKAVDDVPQFIDGLLAKAKDFWSRKTVGVFCEKCEIELVRYWLNFPEHTTLASFKAECPHCGEIITYNR